MAEGHIESYLYVCVCVSDLCPGHNLAIHDGFENNLAQMIVMTRRCVANKNHVTRSKVKVTVHT